MDPDSCQYLDYGGAGLSIGPVYLGECSRASDRRYLVLEWHWY